MFPFTNVAARYRRSQEKRLLLLGLDAAGKTSLLYKLHLNEVVTTIPTVGFNVERVEYKKMDMTIWDIGGQSKLRPLWRHYYVNTDALIFVIDSSDQERLEEARDEMLNVLRDPNMRDCGTVLIFLNKQDLPGAVSPSFLIEKLGFNNALGNPLKHRDWFIQGLKWLSRAGPTVSDDPGGEKVFKLRSTQTASTLLNLPPCTPPPPPPPPPSEPRVGPPQQLSPPPSCRTFARATTIASASADQFLSSKSKLEEDSWVRVGMGLILSRIANILRGLQEKRLLLLGLDAAGKTSLLYRLHLNEFVKTIPTVGFNVERVKYKKIDMTIWDIGGQSKLRPLYRHYYVNMDALIFVIDSADQERLEEARDVMLDFLGDPDTRDCHTVLIFLNKQDLPGAISSSFMTEKLGLNADGNPLNRCDWFIQACCATTGDGIYEGLNWLSSALSKTKPGPTTG
eukprot:jgi/Undpi1/9628/HiC_scaffold_27.g12084.m1